MAHEIDCRCDPCMRRVHREFYDMVGATMVAIEQQEKPLRSEDVLAIDTDAAILVCSRSSASWKRHRWTEINVFYFADALPGGIHWVTEILGCSGVAGERTKRQRLASSHLERALKLIDESDMGVAVREEAREWAERNGVIGRNIIGQKVPEQPGEALQWLFKGPLDDQQKAFAVMDLDLRGLENGRLFIPFDRILPFVDRDAFLSDLGMRHGNS